VCIPQHLAPDFSNFTNEDYKLRTMENHQTQTNRNSDKKKKMELDKTHIT
jgi:hypothetical protein